MNLPLFLRAFRWLIWDTVRQAVASGLFWVMLAVTCITTLFCLSIGFQGGDLPANPPGQPTLLLPSELPESVVLPTDRATLAKKFDVSTAEGQISIGFGLLEIEMNRDRATYVRYIQLLMAGFVADAAGLLLALVWTAGFLPGFLDRFSAPVLLAKPMPRWSLLLGKYLGVLSFVLFQASLFVGATWLALGVVSGVWNGVYLLTIPLLLVHFAVFFGVSAFIAVSTRSTIACIVGSILFWMLCWGMNYGRHVFFLNEQAAEIGSATQFLVDLGYWIMPKPADFNLILFQALGAEESFERVLDLQAMNEKHLFDPDLSVLSSLGFLLVILVLSVYEFRKTDY